MLASLDTQNGAWLVLAQLTKDYPAPSDAGIELSYSPSPNQSDS